MQLRRGTRFTTPRSTEKTTSTTNKVVTRRSGIRRKPLPKGFRSTSSPELAEYSEATEQVSLYKTSIFSTNTWILFRLRGFIQ